MHDKGKEKGRRNEFEARGSRKPEEPAAKDDVSQRRFLETHCLVHPVNWKGGMNIPKSIACVPNFLCGLIKGGRTREFRDNRKGRFGESGGTHAWASLTFSSPPGGGGGWWGRASRKHT